MEPDEWSFRKHVIDRFWMGYQHPDRWNAEMDEKAKENETYLLAKLPVPTKGKRIRNGFKSTQFRWWLAGRISDEIREELRLR